jgi:pimeloyl-ACP methyl ester carboxylesterase
MPEELQLRIYGDDSLPTLVYFPGLHGDWTLVGGFRKHLAGRVRFVEFTYPRTLDWSLDDYAAAIENMLAKNGIARAWLLGESYGSQVLWALAGRKKFNFQGLILAGGFVRHPLRRAMQLAEKLCGRLPASMLVWIMFSYAKLARCRYRHSPDTLATIDEFIARRTGLDRQAAQHRLHLIAGSDPRQIVSQTRVPVFYLTGILDPIVPWPWVRPWLEKNCPMLRDCKIIRTADHNVLGTAPKESAAQVLGWMNQWRDLHLPADDSVLYSSQSL